MIKMSTTISAAVTALILSVPLIAMQFTDEVDWGVGDFVLMGALIFATGLAISYVLRNVSKKYRFPIVAGIIITFILIWMELAVGFIEQLLTGQLHG
jgi:hypothetical protein